MKTLLSILVISWLASKMVLTVIRPLDSCSIVHAQVAPIIREVHSMQWQPHTSALSDLETTLERARKMVKAGNYKEALSILSPFSSEPMKYPTIYSDYMVILFWDGKADEAIRLFEDLPASFPRRAYLLRNMAKAYYEKKEYLKKTCPH